MIVGAWFRKNYDKFKIFQIRKIFFVLLSLIMHFVSKYAFTKYNQIATIQIINQFILLLTVFSVFSLFISFKKN